jgi:hypothetical protein
MTKKIFLSNSLLLLLLFSQCCFNGYDGGRYIDFYNNSGKPIYHYIPREYDIFYPDTSLPEKKPNLYKINREWHISLNLSENQIFKNLSDTLSIFFFDPDTLAKYEWATIRQEYKILMRYDLSHNDLKKLDWCIYYPPIEAMKNIKMWPPYP